MIDQGDVVLVDVKAEKAKAAGRRAADDVKQDQCLGHEVVLGLVPL